MSKRIVVVGAGVAGLEALAVLQAADTSAEVVVVAPEEHFTVRALGVGEPFGLGHPHRYPLDELVPTLGGRLVDARLRRVVPEDRHIELEDGRSIDYDALLVAVGCRMVPAFDHGMSFDRAQTPEDFDDALRDTRRGLVSSVAVVVPPEARWALPAYELALLLRAYDARDVPVTLVTHEARPLGDFGSDVSRRVAGALAEAGVSWQHSVIRDIATDTALRAGRSWLRADRIVHLPVPVGRRVEGLPHQDGLVVVGAAGRVPVADGRVWAAGDGTVAGRGSGAIAAQLAGQASADIVLRVDGRTMPQPPRLSIYGLLRTADGPLYLRADLEDPEATSTWSTAPLWWPPSKVAAPWLTSALVARPVEASRPDAAKRVTAVGG